jgi:hypothetical protein
MKVHINTKKPTKDWTELFPPPIKYERPERSKDIPDEDWATFKLRTNPTDKDSQTYELRVLLFEHGPVEEFIRWKRDLNKILIGQNVTTASNKYAMVRRTLAGDALAAFDRHASTFGPETDDNYGKTLNALAEYIFPRNALILQKHWMRRAIKKPFKTTVRSWVTRINEINDMLVEFPPAFNSHQQLQEDELKELFEYGIPTSWRKEMVRQGFFPCNQTTADIIEFCERMETTEDTHRAEGEKNKKNGNGTASTQRRDDREKQQGSSTSAKSSVRGNSKNNGKRKERCRSFKESDGTDGCSLHIWAKDHTTHECHVVKKQIANMRAQWEAQPREKRQKNDARNKKPPNNDLHTLVQELNKVKEQLARVESQSKSEIGKRKVRIEEEESLDSFQVQLDQLSINESGCDEESNNSE